MQNERVAEKREKVYRVENYTSATFLTGEQPLILCFSVRRIALINLREFQALRVRSGEGKSPATAPRVEFTARLFYDNEDVII